MTTLFATSGNSTIVRSIAVAVAPLIRTYFRTISRLLPGLAVRHAEDLFTRPPRHARHRPPPVDARRETIVAGGRSLAVWQAGPATADTVLLVHGWGGRAVQMSGFIAPLLAHGYRVVWFDQPGHGESDRGRVALPDMLRALDALAATHGPFAAAIGHSLGAAALGLALRRSFALRRVVFVSPPASIAEHAHNFARLLGFTSAVREAMQRRLERHYGIRFADIDRSEELEQVCVPALFLHDGADREVPFVHAQRMSAQMPHARLIKTWGLGHHRILRDREVIRAAVEFIDGDDEAIPAELHAIPAPAPMY